MTTSSAASPKVFISYTHDSPEHMGRVLSLSDRLRAEGVDCHIDQYETSPPEGWPRWTSRQIEEADYVLVVCTGVYERRFKGSEEAGKGLGAQWEGAIITQELYTGAANNKKFIPVLFSPDDSHNVPRVLRGVQSYNLSRENGYTELYRRLTNQPRVRKPNLGSLKPLPIPERRQDFSDARNAPHKSSSSQRREVILVAVVIFIIVLAAATYFVLSSKGQSFELTASRISAYMPGSGVRLASFLLILVYALLACAVLIANKVMRRAVVKAEPEILKENIESGVRMFFESLKARYQTRYRQKLDGRLEITLEVRNIWGARRAQFVKEKFGVEANDGEKVGVVNDVIEQVFANQGGLIIVGNPGAGKTVLLLKLAAGLLKRVDISKKEAFPVIFNLATWSPTYERFEDWLTVTLASGYGLSKNFATTLLHQGRIIFLLDGLDELASNADEKTAARIRVECLKSLNQYISRGKRVVICCRRYEFLQVSKLMGGDGSAAACVTLLDLTSQQIEKALSEAASGAGRNGRGINAASANHLLELLRQKRGKALLEVLRTPFYFTAALEVFDKVILDDPLIPNKADELKKYLLRKFIETKFHRTPNPNHFKPEQTRWWLGWVAVVLMGKRRVTFELTDLQPYHIQLRVLYVFFSSICFGLFTELFVLGMLGKSFWGIGFPAGVLLTTLSESRGGFSKRLIVTDDIRRWEFRQILKWATWERWLGIMLTLSLAAGAVLSLLVKVSGISVITPTRAFLFMFLSLLAVQVFQVAINSSKRVTFFSHLRRPYQRLTAGVGFTVTKFWMVGAITSLLVMYEFKQVSFSVVIVGSLYTASLGLMTTPLLRHLILRLCLFIEGKTPLKFATFLDYAAEASILEKDGGQWRFRHQNLQDFFALKDI
ncbi:MAG TPA: SEFIR domain-containing protein [Pyrinomonadaceae bacterium]|jgi:hypothetical protein